MAVKKSDKSKDSLREKVAKTQAAGAKRVLLEELFQDMSARRWQIYRINFIRGIFFGLGSVLGGTIVIAIAVWLLSAIGAVVPFLSDFIQEILDTLSSRA